MDPKGFSLIDAGENLLKELAESIYMDCKGNL
jgi:hypothetical protein